MFVQGIIGSGFYIGLWTLVLFIWIFGPGFPQNKAFCYFTDKVANIYLRITQLMNCVAQVYNAKRVINCLQLYVF